MFDACSDEKCVAGGKGNAFLAANGLPGGFRCQTGAHWIKVLHGSKSGKRHTKPVNSG